MSKGLDPGQDWHFVGPDLGPNCLQRSSEDCGYSQVLVRLIVIWVKVFKINPEFRILRLTFYRKSASKCWIRQTLQLLWLVSRWSKYNQSFKLEIIHFCRHPASFKIWISKVQDFRNFELSPLLLCCSCYPGISWTSCHWRDNYWGVWSQLVTASWLWGKCQKVWIQVRTDILSVLTCVQTVCKGHQ